LAEFNLSSKKAIDLKNTVRKFRGCDLGTVGRVLDVYKPMQAQIK
jgi:hypothetical protein